MKEKKTERSGRPDWNAALAHGFSVFYDAAYYMGIQTHRYAKRFFKRLLQGLAVPFRYLLALLRVAWLAVDRFALKSTHSFLREAAHLRREAGAALRNLRRARQGGWRAAGSVLLHYIGKAFERYPRLWRSAALAALPLIAFIVMVGTVGYWSGSTFALEVFCDETSVGYVKSEAVVQNASEQVLTRMKASGSAEEIGDTSYAIRRVGLNELMDASALSEKLIAGSASNITNGCGVYIDGALLCAVKNETDAASMFDQLLAPYRETNPDAIAGFVEDVRYTQGLYPDTPDIMWDASRLLRTLHSTKADAVHYAVEAGDTVSGIAQKFDKSSSDLYAMNPGLSEEIHVGDDILISTQVNFVRVKLVRTEQRVEETAYETVETKNGSMYKGTKKTKVKGQKGEVRVTEMVSYVDGVAVSRQEVDREVLREPTTEEVEVGTKSTSSTSGLPGSGSYHITTTNGRFIWPCVGLHDITSPYGYRWGRLHGGVDITGSGATGKLILAAESGTVELAGWNGAYGNCIIINHGGGVKTLYGHCSSIGVSRGQSVSQGEAIGRVGSTGQVTGPHLHFEVYIDGGRVNPAPYIGR